MGLLEQLAKEAEQRREEDERNASRRAELEKEFNAVTRPAMGKLFNYAKEVVKHLNYIGRDIEVEYHIPLYGEITAKLNPDYRVRVSKDDDRIDIRLDVTASIPHEQSKAVFLRSGKSLEQLESLILERGLSADRVFKKDREGNIIGSEVRIYGTFHLTIHIHAEVMSDFLVMNFTNFEILGNLSRRVLPSNVDDDCLDRFGRFLAREDNAFLQEGVSEEYRDKIRDEIRRQEEAKRAELAREHDPEPEPEPNHLGQRFLQQLKELSKKI